jgi:hypothetical protein
VFKDHIAVALSRARGRALDDISRTIWAGLSQGLLDDDEAQAFAEQLHARRMAENACRASPAAAGGFGRPRSIFPVRRPQRPRLRAASIERRRRLAASGPMPPALACQFTTGELAVMRIVADEVRDRGACTRPIDAIAARAGVGRTTVQNAMRAAVRLGVVKIEERRVTGAKNLPNRITVTSPEWKLWIARAARSKATGFKKASTTEMNFLQKKEEQAKTGPRSRPGHRDDACEQRGGAFRRGG